MTRRAPTAIGLLLCAAALLGALPAHADALLVKLRSEPAAGAPASLDRFQRSVGPRSVRPLFRRGGRSFAPQQRAARGAAAPPDLSNVYRVELAAGVDAASAAARASADPDVVWVQPDYPMQLDFVPDDPFFFSSGSWGQPYADLWGLRKIRAPEAWQLSLGEGAVIAVVDTGLDASHPDIAAHVWVNPGEDVDGDGRATAADRNGVDDDANGLVDDLTGYDFFNDDPDPFDDNGHGTHVAGIAAAVGGNALGILGVAPRARVMALKGFPAAGGGDSSALAEAIVYAARNGADVINNSWSCSVRCPTNPVIDEAVLSAHALGAVVVTSAGNTADDVVFQSPKNKRETIVVASSREDDSIAPSSSHGLLVDLAAPGAGTESADPFAGNAILSLLSSGAPPEFSERLRVGDVYVRLTGTSQAAPHVTGVVALMRALEPNASPEEIRARLRASARDVGAPGHDPVYGAGIVDALAALTARAPRVRGEIARPFAGEIVHPAPGGAVSVTGSAGGDEFAAYALAFGRGLEPTSWQPIPAAGASPVEGGVLATWDVSGLAPGPYALRLSVTSRSGEAVVEFAPLSLERTRPVPVSLEGALSFAPDVSGALAVYESERSDTGPDVFAADLRSGRERAVSDAPGPQRQARVSGRRIVWRDTGSEPGGEIRTCAMDFGLTRCSDVAVATGPGERSAPVVSGARVFWTESDASGESPRLCDLSRDPHSCRVRPVAVRPERQLDLEVSGSRLVWRELSPVFSIWSCVLSLRGDACRARLVDSESQFSEAPAVSGASVAWDQFNFWPDFGLGYRVNVCRLEAGDGPCAPVLAGEPSLSANAPDVSGDTVVWSSDAPGEPAALFFCEHDPVANTCPAQRLTGSAAGARNPAIDGRRVVFEDERDGPTRIYALELPDLLVLGDRRVREGQLLRLAIFGRDPEGKHLRLSAQLSDGAPVESLGMRFAQKHGAALLLWRPGTSASGRHAVRFEGDAANGLVTRETVELIVDDAKPVRR